MAFYEKKASTKIGRPFFDRFVNKFIDRVPVVVSLIFPIILGAGILYLTTSIVYFGGRRESLAAHTEGSFIERSLYWTQHAPINTGKVIVVSARDEDADALPRAPVEEIVDLHISEYARAVEQALSFQPRLVVVSWLGNAHPLTESYLKPLTDVILKAQATRKVWMAVPYSETGSVPEALDKTFNFHEARDCVYEVNNICTYIKDWEWINQALANEFWEDPPPHHISLNLPHFYPNFILNLPDGRGLTHYSFLDLKTPGKFQPPPGTIIFIGNDTKQGLIFRHDKNILQRTYTATSWPRRALFLDGEPFHVFWARLTQMFLDRTTIAVAPAWTTRAGTIFMCVLVVAGIWFYGALALGPFLICALLMPMVNIAGVYLFRVYVPIFDMIFVGSLSFIATTFLSVSYSSLRRWQIDAAHAQNAFTSDIKSNMISLLSHNLNTPVAQLRGLMEVLRTDPALQDSQEDFAACFLDVEKLQLCVRTVLMTTSLESELEVAASTMLRDLLRDFSQISLAALRRVGIIGTISPEPDADDSDVLFQKVPFELPILQMAMTAIALTSLTDGQYRVHLTLTIDTHAGTEMLTILPHLPESTEDLKAGRRFVVDSFLHGVLKRFLLTLIRRSHHRGLDVTLLEKTGGGITYFGLRLPCQPKV